MMKQTKFWVILFSVLFVLGCGGFLLLRSGGHAGHVAESRIDGALYKSIDLDAVTVPYEIEIQTDYGENTIYVEHGKISVTHADCPDQICVKQGAIQSSAVPIACVPHHLSIEIGGEP